MAKIINKQYVREEYAYDISMPKTHNFYANGILVHNCDLPSRSLLVGDGGNSGYLYGRWGNKAAQISTRTTVRLKSAILDTNRYFNGSVEDSVVDFSKSLPAPPQGISDNNFVFGFEDDEGNHIPGLIEVSDSLKKYATSRPEEWGIVSKAMGLTRAFSKHASAFVIADKPIHEIIPTKEGNITQYEAKAVEENGLVKYDFLVINILKDIELCLKLINKKNNEQKPIGYFTHQGKGLYIWDLPEIGEVFRSIWSGETSTLWQINTHSMVPYVIEMLPNSVMDLATLLALVRPGPLDYIDENTGRNMTEEYMARRRGESEPDIKEMGEILKDTLGTLCFQEDLNKIAINLAGFSSEEAELLRENMAKKKMVELMKMKPSFVSGAKQKVSEEVAEKIWEQMVTFGRYGFSIIHAVEYGLTTYASMFLKHFYKLEWWASILSNASEQEISTKFWPHVKDFVMPPDINLSGDTMVVDYANQTIRSKLGIIRGMGDSTIEPIVNNRPYKDVNDFVNKEVAGDSTSHKLIHVGVLDSLFPPRTSLIEKLKMYQQAVEDKKFADKVKAAQEKGKTIKALAPKEAAIPEKYLDLHPLKDAAMRKSVLPSLPIDLFALGSKYSKVLYSYTDLPAVKSKNGHRTPLLNGDKLRRLYDVPGENVEKDIYVAATCFVLEAKEFPYAKNTKKALKMNLDADGFIKEFVMWPDYNTGALLYPSTVKKGAIVTVFFRKKVGRKDLSVLEIVVETEAVK